MELPTIFVFTMTPWATARMDRPISRSSSSCAARRSRPGRAATRDANEVVEAYRYILQLRHQPAVIALVASAAADLRSQKVRLGGGVARVAYVMADAPGGPPEIILIASR